MLYTYVYISHTYYLYVVMPGGEYDKSKEQKQKLTLSINRDVIEKAKESGVNISAITEQVLKAITYVPSGNTLDDIAEAYTTLFDAIKPILKSYGAYVKVGEIEYAESDGSVFAHGDIRLGPYGLYADRPDDSTIETSVRDVVSDLFKPKEILERLIPALIAAAENNKARIKEFEIALKFVEILPDDKGVSK